MDETSVSEAARLLWRCWTTRAPVDLLPAHCRPADRRAGYAVQAVLARQIGQPVRGWKIAATNVAGQRHINVDGPLAGRLFADRVVVPGARVPLEGNPFRVAEAEFAFRMRRALPPRAAPYGAADLADAVAALHPAIEIPDTRLRDYVHAGAAQLLADNACSGWFAFGAEAPGDWRALDLAAQRVTVRVNGAPVCEGAGERVLGSPWHALAWLANELSEHGSGLQAGDYVSTGTCNVPQPVAPGDEVVADFGALGSVGVRLA